MLPDIGAPALAAPRLKSYAASYCGTGCLRSACPFRLQCSAIGKIDARAAVAMADAIPGETPLALIDLLPGGAGGRPDILPIMDEMPEPDS